MSRAWAALLLVAITAGCGGGTDQLDRAAKVLADDAGFVTAAGMSAALNQAAAHVLADARSCAKKRSAQNTRCVARFRFAAFLQAESVEVTACDRDTRRAVRVTVRRALSRIDDGDIPQLVQCSH